MIESILVALHNATTLLFGVYISAAFWGIKLNRKNIFILFGFSCAVGAVYIEVFTLFGETVTRQVYPFIVHLPLVLFLMLFYKYKLVLSLMSVLTGYLCCQISKWVGIAAEEISGLETVYYGARVITTVTVFALLLRFVSEATAQLIQKPDKELLILAVMPLTYYLFDYLTGVYTGLLYSGKAIVAEFLGFALCIAYLLFLLVYFKQYEEKREAEQKIRLIEMQRANSQKEIEANRRSQYAVSLIRHDMRHFLANISAFIDNGEYVRAKEYINEIISQTEKTAPHKYCKNTVVNMILSSYESDIHNNGIDFKYEVQIPEKLIVSDIDLTSILSNALENAIHAVLRLEREKRFISLDLKMKESKLLIELKNTFYEKPEIIDGIPRSREHGHGFGTQSIHYVTEKLNGNCQFAVCGDLFILRVIL